MDGGGYGVRSTGSFSTDRQTSLVNGGLISFSFAFCLGLFALEPHTRGSGDQEKWARSPAQRSSRGGLVGFLPLVTGQGNGAEGRGRQGERGWARARAFPFYFDRRHDKRRYCTVDTVQYDYLSLSLLRIYPSVTRERFRQTDRWVGMRGSRRLSAPTRSRRGMLIYPSQNLGFLQAMEHHYLVPSLIPFD